MPRKKKKETDKNESTTIDHKRVSREKDIALTHAKKRCEDEGCTIYVHQSTKWIDTFFISRLNSHPNSELIETFD